MNPAPNHANFELRAYEASLGQLTASIAIQIQNFNIKIHQDIDSFKNYISRQYDEFKTVIIGEIDQFTTLQDSKHLSETVQTTSSADKAIQNINERPVDLSIVKLEVKSPEKLCPDRVLSAQSFSVAPQIVQQTAPIDTIEQQFIQSNPQSLQNQQTSDHFSNIWPFEIEQISSQIKFEPSESPPPPLNINNLSSGQQQKPSHTEISESIIEPLPNISQQAPIRKTNSDITTTSKSSSKYLKSSKDRSSLSTKSHNPKSKSNTPKDLKESKHRSSTRAASSKFLSKDRTSKRSRSRSAERSNSKIKRLKSTSDSTSSIESFAFGHPSNHFASQKSFKVFLVKCIRCRDCRKDFPNRLEYDAHFLADHGILPHICPQAGCTLRFKSLNSLFDHMNSSVLHRRLAEWNCYICDAQCTTAIKLSKHADNAHLFGQFQCTAPGCNFVGSFKCEVFKHSTEEHYSTDGTLRDASKLLQDRFKAVTKTASFFNSQHKYRANKIMCSVKDCKFECSFKLGDAKLKNHLKIEHGFKHHRCSGCDQSFDFRNDLKIHVKKNHTADSWRCSQCSSVLGNGFELNEHNVIYHYRGDYSCRKRDCHFSASLIIDVISHYDQEHDN